jgi:polyisoprenyl-phosphate glycosyltransferase
MMLAIVVPCYNEEEVLPETSSRLLQLLTELNAGGMIGNESRVCFVDDGSTDRTWAIVEALSSGDPRFAGIKLAHNRGHQNALLAGLFTVNADAVVTIDADLQDDISAIKEMVREFRSGVDVVYGVRKKRVTDTWFKRKTARIFYSLMRVLGVELVSDHADFRLMSRRAVEALMEFREVNLFLRGIVPLIGFRSSIVYYDRAERFAGRSKYPFARMLAFAIDGITSFSVVPLRLITGIGFFTFLVSLLLSIWTLVIRFLTDRAVPGWTSTVLPMYVLGGVQIFCLGVIGEYLGKIYSETKGRPKYIIEKTLSI